VALYILGENGVNVVSLNTALKFCFVINFENLKNSAKANFIKFRTLTLAQQYFCTVFGLRATTNEKSYLYQRTSV